MQSKAYKNLLKGAGSLVDIIPSRPPEGYKKGLFLKKKSSTTRTIRNCWEEVGNTIRIATTQAISEETAAKPGTEKTVVRLVPKEDTGEWRV